MQDLPAVLPGQLFATPAGRTAAARFDGQIIASSSEVTLDSRYRIGPASAVHALLGRVQKVTVGTH